MAAVKSSRTDMSKKNSAGKKKTVKKSGSDLSSHNRKRTESVNSRGKTEKKGAFNHKTNRNVNQTKKKNQPSRGAAAVSRSRPYNWEDSLNNNNTRYHSAGGYEPPTSYYAGRGQMSYEEFVRNRELFGGEEEAELPRNRRTGGTVKKTPEQGRNNKNGSNIMRTESSKTSANGSRKSKKDLKKEAKARKSKVLGNKKRNLTREKMDERARRKRIKRHAGRAPKSMTPRKRKIKRFFTGFSIFMVIAVVSVLLSLTVFFKMERIIVTGETRYSQEDIINLSQIETGENIFLCDKAAASKRIVDALPYVAEAKVGFVIPNAITIEIVEEVPSYAMGYQDGYYIVGENGRILEKTAENYYGLPIVQGAEITSNKVGEYANFSDEKITAILAELVRVLDAYNFDDITIIDVSDTANIRFLYDDRITVVLGIPEDLDYKVNTAQTIINDKLDPNGTGLIKGRLDVSMCKDTKKSYFKENEGFEATQNTQTVTAEPESVEEQTAETSEEQPEETAEPQETDTAEDPQAEEVTEAETEVVQENSAEEETSEAEAAEEENAGSEGGQAETEAENPDSENG